MKKVKEEDRKTASSTVARDHVEESVFFGWSIGATRRREDRVYNEMNEDFGCHAAESVFLYWRVMRRGCVEMR